MKKPIKCEDCPVCRAGKDNIYCGCSPELKAEKKSSRQKIDMWKKCPIQWDK